MAFINFNKKEIQAKIVYYGPGRGGKTTNLEYIHREYKDRIKTEMITVKTKGDRTLFFDFLPLNVGNINGYSLKFQLYTVPGQVMYNETRKLVLRGVDGIVFVADSLAMREEKNIISLKNLQENLSAYNKNIFNIPMVMQFNKRDLEEQGIPLIPVETLQKGLNSKLNVPWFQASAASGNNVLETLKTIVSLTAESITKEIQ
ncbi:MAG: GTPase domain-containing protein [Deltaproteobacteria bacterium]|nr:GTPase domain-containing protein [Deltaproteobacteria bacterium]